MWQSYNPGAENVSPKPVPVMKINPAFPGGTVELRRYKARDPERAPDVNERVENLQTAESSLAVPENSPGITSRLPSFSGHDREPSSGSYNLSTGTSYYSCVSQITIGFDVAGQVAIGFSHWKNPFHATGWQFAHSPHCSSEDAGSPTCPHCMPQAEFSDPVSCPASISITPVPSYSSSQETISEDNTGIWGYSSYSS